VTEHTNLVLAELREVPEACSVYVAVGVLEPFVNCLESGEDILGVVVDHVDRGHVAFALVTAQVEAQVLL